MCYVTGVVVPVYMSCDPSFMNVEERVAENITASATAVNNKCAPNVKELVRQYHQTSVESDKSHYRHLIYKRYLDMLEATELWDKIQGQAEMLTKMALGDVRVDRAEAVSSIILYCEVSTVAALLYLQQMIDSDELSRLISVMLSLLADTDIVAAASLSAQEYDTALTYLNSAAGKDHLLIILM